LPTWGYGGSPWTLGGLSFSRVGSPWSLEDSPWAMEAHPGAVQAHPGALHAHSKGPSCSTWVHGGSHGAVEVYLGASPWSLKADPGPMEAHTRNFAKLKPFSYKFQLSRNSKSHFRKHPKSTTSCVVFAHRASNNRLAKSLFGGYTLKIKNFPTLFKLILK
jgi:hypothetical protein